MKREHVNQNWIEDAAEEIVDYVDECGGECYGTEKIESIIRERVKSLVEVLKKVASPIHHPFSEALESEIAEALKPFITQMIARTTEFSPDRLYRYTLWRELDPNPILYPETHDKYAMFIGLNPSTADEIEDDPTIRRCMGFARSWGYGALCMTNIFAFRATDPDDMMAQAGPIGRDNAEWLARCAFGAGIIVCAWGLGGKYMDRGKEVIGMLRYGGAKLHCLRKTKDGLPEHPLYLPKTLMPIPL